MTPTKLRTLAKSLGLRIVSTRDLSIRRERSGEAWHYVNRSNRRIKAARVVDRLNRLAVPPAYVDVLYASDPHAHLQAIGRDAAGRTQYAYHPKWEKVREVRKAERLTSLIEVLPRVRRALTARLNEDNVTREFTLACVVELIATTAIRAGSEEYAKEHKTRGAATLLKSNAKCDGDVVTLRFRAKGGKAIHKEFKNARLSAAIARLAKLPGARLFQYRDADGNVRAVTANDVNAYLKEISGCEVSLKDFRTLVGTAEALQELAVIDPAPSAAGRKRQIKAALTKAAATLENTLTVCRKSYVHPAVLTAFESGLLKKFADRIKAARSPAPVQAVVAELIETAPAPAAATG
jgi:DNA topoisomerase-1